MDGLQPPSVVLVTGASGWVGGHVCQLLVSKGYTVRAAVRDPAAARVAFLKTMGCELVRVPDLLSDEGWAEAMAGCDGLAHVASPVDISADASETDMVAQAGTHAPRRLQLVRGGSEHAQTRLRVPSVRGLCYTHRATNSRDRLRQWEAPSAR